ncbi:FecCD family ABC transporter permease [Kineococcus sp. SYSU DK001]|uniref:FecCD family ABC transporter permease n=1 Tax=Kineococcus sp. SYSU DK001 TaxID=3383122 RepID=UPI003D7E7DF4
MTSEPALAAPPAARAARPARRRGGVVAFHVLAVAALLLSVAATATLGAADVSLVNVRDILLNHLGLADVPVRVSEDAIVWQDRVPRSLVAAACGAGLGLCGLVMQSLLRNPLADPFVLGISSGASTGAVAVAILGLGTGLGLSAGAFVGAVAAFAFTLVLSRLTRSGSTGTLLAGVAATHLFSALTSLVVFAFADSDETRGVMFWLLGSLEGIRWPDVVLTASVVAVGAVVVLAHARRLDAFAFGEDVAASLGVPVARVRAVLLLLTALVTATLVSVAGTVGFVGLVLPHVARLVVGPGHTRTVPATIVLGALSMVWIDALSRVAFSPTPLPVGVGTALVGVPVFVVLLVRRRRVP